jgi:hypothetical protein
MNSKIIKHLHEAVLYKSYFDLMMAANLIKLDKKQSIRSFYGWDPAAIVGLYMDVEGHFKKNGYNENGQLPDWCMETLIEVVNRIQFKKQTMDMIQEAEKNLQKKDEELIELQNEVSYKLKEIDEALEYKDKNKFQKLTKELKKIEEKIENHNKD